MQVLIPLSNCKHLPEVSVYNSNYYHLPFSVNGMNIIHEYYSGSEELAYISLGYFKDNKFKDEFYLNTSILDEFENDTIVFDSDLISTENKWT